MQRYDLKLGAVQFSAGPGWAVTTLPDGKRIHAAPEDTASYRATAERAGYGADVARLCAEHELLHTALSQFLGLPESLTLRAVADDVPAPDHSWIEEEAVLAVARLVNAWGVDLAAVLSRATERKTT